MKPICPKCNLPCRYTSGPGRFMTYRGVRCEIPATLKIKNCLRCKADWISNVEEDALSDSLEKQRLAATKGKK